MGFEWDEMRKLQENEKNLQIRLTSRFDEKIHHCNHEVEQDKEECEAVTEVSRLRELALEQQEIIEVLRQAVKEKERKLDQLSNKKRKEEFYKQWLELEPVAEVEDEDERDEEQEEEDRHRRELQLHQEEGDSALSSGPSSLSPQLGGQANWSTNSVTRDLYESVLLEIEELQTRLLEEQRELELARCQVRDLEKALLQETQGSQASRQALKERLREAEEREATLAAEVSELREQNELLEFRVLELEESPNSRDTPDLADSGVVSPEPIHLYKDHPSHKVRDRAVATVIPYTDTFNSNPPPTPMSEPSKAPLSLQESGIFEEEDDTGPIELYTRGTQTEVPGGELLQEVKRLQELRARIQERAASKSSNSNSPSSPVLSPFDFPLTDPCDKIRELEENLALKRERESELLNENHRLSAELDIYRTKSTANVHVMTDKTLTLDAGIMTEVLEGSEESADERFKSSLAARSRNSIRKLQTNSYCPLMKQSGLVTWPKSEPPQVQPPKFTANLYQSDSKRSETKALTEAKRREFFERLFSSCPDESTPMEVDGQMMSPAIVITEAERDEADIQSFTFTAKEDISAMEKCAALGAPPPVPTGPEEVEVDPSSSDQKVSESASQKTRRLDYERNVISNHVHRLTLYQEICV